MQFTVQPCDRSDGGFEEQISNRNRLVPPIGDQNDCGPPKKSLPNHWLPGNKTPVFGCEQRPDNPGGCHATVSGG
jgi:hypothetical protein